MDYKREPLETQAKALSELEDRERYILMGAPGSGKSLVLTNDFQRRFLKGEISAVVLAVPALNIGDWENDHLPKDMNVDYRLFIYRAFKTKKIGQEYETFKKFTGLRILLVSNEMLSIAPHQNFIEAFLRKYSCGLYIDEVHDYASPESKRTTFVTSCLYHAVGQDGNYLERIIDGQGRKRWKGTAVTIRHLAKVIGIATGTLFTQSPMSLWASQKLMNFNTETIAAFRSKYMITMLDQTASGQRFSRSLMPREIAEVRKALETNGAEEVAAMTGYTLENVRAIASSKLTLPYKNLESLKRLVDQYAVRMPLPEAARLPVVDVELLVPMTKEQKELTSKIVAESLAFIEEKGVAVGNALNIHLRLAQISSGFMPVNVIQNVTGMNPDNDPDDDPDDDETFDEYPDFDRLTRVKMDPIKINERSPKLEKLIELLGELDFEKPALVSCLFRAELKAVVDAIAESLPSLRVGVIQGGMKKEERAETLRKFDAKEIDIIVLNERAGRGLNLQLADKLIIVSSSSSADRRKQLIARIRRTGQLAEFLRVWHILCERSIDVKIEKALEQLATIANFINDDVDMSDKEISIDGVIKEYLEGKDDE